MDMEIKLLLALIYMVLCMILWKLHQIHKGL